MLWVAVFALVCMAAVGIALVGITAYLLFALARSLVQGVAGLLPVDRRAREPEPAGEPPQPVPHG